MHTVSFIGQDVLTLNELYDVLNELHVVRAKWHLLGGSLRLKESVLAAIRAEFRDIPDNCLREMLSYWLKQVTPRPCWSAIVAALRMPIVYEPQLAQTLKAKYCPGVFAATVMFMYEVVKCRRVIR